MEILTQLFRAIGDNVSIDTPFHCNLGINISIGSNVIIGVNCTFIDDSPILIGDNVLIAPNVQIYTASHPTAASERLIEDWEGEKQHIFQNICQTGCGRRQRLDRRRCDYSPGRYNREKQCHRRR